MSLDSTYKLTVIISTAITGCAVVVAALRWILHHRDVISQWAADLPFRVRARWLARQNIRALDKFATLRGLTADQEAKRMGYNGRRSYAREARQMHFRQLRDPTLGLDR